VTPDEIIDDLNQKFFVALITYSSGFVRECICRVIHEDAIQDQEGVRLSHAETFTAFRKRFPKRQMIDGKLQNVGDFWLRSTRARRENKDSPMYVQR
jgi:hypothetical protein